MPTHQAEQDSLQGPLQGFANALVNLENVKRSEEEVVVLLTDGLPATLTAGVIDRLSWYAYSSGQCLALAIALAERTGWPIYLRLGHGLVGRRRKPVDYIIHAMVQTPAGYLLDIHGVRAAGDWIGSGKEIDHLVVPASEARALLTRYAAGMVEQNIEAAETFVDPVLSMAYAPITEQDSFDLED